MPDHIQIPQGWMRNFMHKTSEGEKVYCYLCQTKDITEKKIRDLGAEENYYIDDFEKYLDRNWENKFGEVSKRIRKGIKASSNTFEMTQSDIDFIKKFLSLSMGRSKIFKNSIANLWDKPYPIIGLREIAPLSVLSVGSMFQSYGVQFLYNATDLGFVLPSISYFYVADGSDIYPVMVITDKIAIKFLKKQGNQENNKTNYTVTSIYDEEKIKEFNHCAFITERYTNNDFIISKNKEELVIIKNGDNK